MFNNFTFPSVYEMTLFSNDSFNDEEGSGSSFLRYNNYDYSVGTSALNDGISPNKIINASPYDDDYKIITQAAMLKIVSMIREKAKNGEVPKITLTTGFPFATFQNNINEAIEYFSGEKTLLSAKIDVAGSVKTEQNLLNIDSVYVIPELQGCDVSLRASEINKDDVVAIISLGFGTCEGAISNSSGIVPRTSFSTHGLSYPVKIFSQELSRESYLGLKNEHQLDKIFSKGCIYINRKKKELASHRKKALTLYYKNVISPILKKYFRDEDFEECSKIVLVGGGANYHDLAELFREEFDSILEIYVPKSPENIASTGYAIYSKLMTQKAEKSNRYYSLNSNVYNAFVGLDVGNANTNISVCSNDDSFI